MGMEVVRYLADGTRENYLAFGKRMGSEECVQGSFWSCASIRDV